MMLFRENMCVGSLSVRDKGLDLYIPLDWSSMKLFRGSTSETPCKRKLLSSHMTEHVTSSLHITWIKEFHDRVMMEEVDDYCRLLFTQPYAHSSL